MHTLRIQQSKLEQATFRLQERDKILFRTCVTSLKNNNKERAAIFANEIAEIRRLIKFLYNVQLAIERVILRLETIKELGDIVIDLKPALKLLQSVSQELFEVLPDVSTELKKVNEAISETLYSTKITADESMIPVGKKTPGGEEILKEVSSFLEQKLAEKLPEPPASQPLKEQEQTTTLKELVALAASNSQATGYETVEEISRDQSKTLLSYKKAEIQEISLKVERPSLEDVLLEYVRKCDGEIDIARCSDDLKIPRLEVEKALESLASKGKIKIELRKEVR
jgi:division protein CdvB (Snf7/Vps24/ESCRT-III family)